MRPTFPMKSNRITTVWIASIFAASLLLISCGGETEERETPPAQANGYVADLGGMLTETQVANIEETLAGFETHNGVKFILYTEPNAPGGNLTAMGERLNSLIPIGSPQLNQGLAILIARQERQAKIEVNHGLEWQIPDSAHSQVFGNMVKYFKEDQYDEGLTYAFGALFSLLEPFSFETEYKSWEEVKAAGEDAERKIVSLNLSLAADPVGSLAETQFSPDFRLQMQTAAGVPVVVLHTRYMENLTNRLTQPGRKSQVYGRIVATNPLTLQLMGVE